MPDWDEITIRPLRWDETDLRQLLAIEQAAFNRFDAYDRQDFERWYHYNPDLCLAAEIDGHMAGYVITRILPEQGDLASLATHPDYLRRGVGAALLRATVEGVRAYGKHQITLEVRKTNLSALAFWLNMGCVPFGVQPGFYTDGEAAILMRKWIG